MRKFLLVLMLAGAATLSAEATASTPKLLSAKLRVEANQATSSIHFEPNVGQVKGRTEWVARAAGATMYITGSEVVLALVPDLSKVERQVEPPSDLAGMFGPHSRFPQPPKHPLYTHNVHMRFAGSASAPEGEGLDPLGSYSNYFLGRTEKEWFTGVPHFEKVRYREVYAGIDVVYYANGCGVEYDFILAPGADPNRIELAFSEPVRIQDGDLVVAGMRQRRPHVFQGARELNANYRIIDGRVRLILEPFDHTARLLIDPVLEFSTYLGGPGSDGLEAVAVDRSGYIYVAGSTQSPQTPSLDPFQQPSVVSVSPMVLKFTPAADRVVYFAVIGSNGWDEARALAVDAAGSAAITGRTRNATFPLKNPIQSEFKAIYDTAFITRLAPDGKSLLFSTYFGGSSSDYSKQIRYDSVGNVYVAGLTRSRDIPIRNAFQPASRGGDKCFLAKIAPAGGLLFSTYFGGSGADRCVGLAVDKSGSACISGGSTSDDFPLQNAAQTEMSPRGGFPTAFVAKFAPDGGSLVFSTFAGGKMAGGAYAMALDADSNIYLGGTAFDGNLATKNAFQSTIGGPINGFLMKLDPQARQILYSTYLGGSGGSWISDIAVDADGSAYVAGSSSSADFPTKNSLQPFRTGRGYGNNDIFVAKFVPAGNALVYSTFLGGSGGQSPDAEIALAGGASVVVAGWTASSDFPTWKAYQPLYGGGFDGFLAKISDNTPLAPSLLSPTPARLVFRYVQGGSVPAAQTFSVSAASAIQFAAAPSDSWLSVAPGSGTTPVKLAVMVDPGKLAPGTYTGSVRLAPLADTPASIDVTLTVLAPAPVLTSVEPALVPAGSDDTVITIHGSGFTKDSQVQVSGFSRYGPVTYVDSNTLRITFAKLDLSDETNFTIAVVNPQSAVSNALSLAVGKPAPLFTAAGVVNAASFAAGPVAPGEIVTIFGTNLDQKVTFDFLPATLVYFSATQVSVTVPYTIKGPATTIQVGLSVPVNVDVAPSAPGIFAAVSAGDGILTLYATGGGVLSKDDLPLIQLPVVVMVNGASADVLYAGIAPGLVEGVNQINIRVPDGTASGQVTLVLKVGDASSKEFSTTLP